MCVSRLVIRPSRCTRIIPEMFIARPLSSFCVYLYMFSETDDIPPKYRKGESSYMRPHAEKKTRASFSQYRLRDDGTCRYLSIYRAVRRVFSRGQHIILYDDRGLAGHRHPRTHLCVPSQNRVTT